jgi:hypothetical protein
VTRAKPLVRTWAAWFALMLAVNCGLFGGTLIGCALAHSWQNFPLNAGIYLLLDAGLCWLGIVKLEQKP